MKEKIVWWLQLFVNCAFFLSLAVKFGSFLLLIIAPFVGYALTVKFENNPDK